MALLHIPLDQIDEARLHALIISESAESRTIDYKRTIYGKTHNDYSEFLADISSFANTSGGDLVLGIEATNGIPTAFAALTMPMEPEILRLEQVARGGLQPRIANIALRAIPIQGGNVLVIRVPRSFSAPHRIIRERSNRFYARSAAGKYEPDVNELRTLFNAGPQVADRIRNFRLDRIAKIAAAQTPVQLMNEGSLVLHIVPLSAFDVTPALCLDQIKQRHQSFAPPWTQMATGARINFDGVLKTSNADPQATQHRAYVQLYRNGIIETVASSIAGPNRRNPIIHNLDDTLISESLRKLNDLAAIGIEPPYALLVSLIGVVGAQFNFARGLWPGDLSDDLDRDQYHFDEVLVETIPGGRAECAKIIRPILDQIANTGGRATSPIFDNQGDYIPAT